MYKILSKRSNNSFITPELRLTTLLSRPKLTPDQVGIVQSFIGTVNIDRFMELVEHHRVWPCVYFNINEHFTDVFPKRHFSCLEKRQQQFTRKCRQQFKTCSQLLSQLKKHGVPVKVLKGMPLGFRLYGDISKRHMRDLDLVIEASHLETAHDVLSHSGFKCPPFEQLTDKQKTVYFNVQKDIDYFNDEGITLELHLRLSGYSNKITDHYLYSLFNQTSSENTTLNELLYLCWHGSNTFFHRLKWLVDIALIIEQNNDLNIISLINLANETGAMRILAVSWTLCNKLFNTEVPNEIDTYYQHDMLSQILVRQCYKQLLHPKSVDSLIFKSERFLGGPFLYHSLSEKMSCLCFMLKPTVLDYKTLPILPDKLFILYALFRPMLMIYRRLLSIKIVKSKIKR